MCYKGGNPSRKKDDDVILKQCYLNYLLNFVLKKNNVYSISMAQFLFPSFISKPFQFSHTLSHLSFCQAAV